MNCKSSARKSIILISFTMASFLCLATDSNYAQFTTSIVPDGTIATTVTQTGQIYNINGGSIHGTNQFHSFDQFSIGNGDIANFNGPAQIVNILGRITGGTASNIDGTLRSTISGANLYLLNPSGILFGPKASLELTGSLHVSSADLLEFEDGMTFYTDTSLDNSANSVLQADPPEAFGFLDPPSTLGFLSEAPAPITVKGSLLTVSDGETISFVGGSIDIASGTVLTSGGSIIFSSVLSDSAVKIQSGEVTQDKMILTNNRSDQIMISSGARVDTSGAPGGPIRIHGGRLVVDNAILDASNKGSSISGGIVIDTAADTVITNESKLIADVSSSGNAGTTQIAGELVEVAQGSFIQSQSSSDSSGETADIEITAGTLRLMEGGQIVSRTQGSGSGGAITISVENDLVMAGSAGAVDPNIANPESPKQSRISTSSSFGSRGLGGNLTVTADNVSMDAARIDAGGFGSGKGGNAAVTVRETLEIRNRAEIATTAARPGVTGGSGTLTVEAQDILVVGIKDPENGGGADFTGFSSATGDGPGGDLFITAKNLTMRNTGLISSVTVGSGDGGNMNIQLSGKLDFSTGAAIVGSTFGIATGNAGSIEVAADEIVLSGNNPVPIPDSFNPNIVFLNVGSIVNSSLPGPGGGNAGDVEVTARTISLKDGGRIDSRTFSSGNGGDVDVTADEIFIADVNPDIIDFFLNGGGTLDFSRDLSRSTITTDSLSVFNRVAGNENNPASGKAGDITVQVKDLKIQDGGVISSRTTSSGSGGTITVMADNITMVNDGQIVASNGLGFLGDSEMSTGDTGEIQITAAKTLTLNKSEMKVDAVNGTVGNLRINVEEDLRLTNSSLITAESLGFKNAGNILLVAGDTIRIDNSEVKTSATQASGGNITLQATNQIFLGNSEVSTSVLGGAETSSGNIIFDPKAIVLQNSQLLATATTGFGGQIDLIGNVILIDPLSTINASAGPAGVDGSVNIRAPIQNLSGTLAPLTEEILNVATIYGASCASQKEGKFSSFIGRSTAMQSQRNGYLSSPLFFTPPYAVPVAANTNTLDNVDSDQFAYDTAMAPSSHLSRGLDTWDLAQLTDCVE